MWLSVALERPIPWPRRKSEALNPKRFGKPFDRLTVLSRVEGLTALSKFEGQIRMTEIQNSKGF